MSDNYFRQNKERVQLQPKALAQPDIRHSAITHLREEYQDSYTKTREYYQKPTHQRVTTGRSTVIQLNDIETNKGTVQYTGTVDYSKLPFDDPQVVQNRLRIKPGSRRVITDLTQLKPQSGTDTVIDTRNTITRQPEVVITDVYTKEGEQKLTFEPVNIKREGAYLTAHKRLTKPHEQEDDWTEAATLGSHYVLDPVTDDFSKNRIDQALSYIETNAGTDLFNQLIQNGHITTPQGLPFADSQIDAFIKTLTERADPTNDIYPPNADQQSALRATDSEVTAIQGPPGTGKTATTLAPLLISRARSFTQRGALRGLVVAPSNKAVDEIAAATAQLRNALKETRSRTPTNKNETISLYRLGNASDEFAFNDIDGIQHIATASEFDTTDIAEALLRPERASTANTLIFTTPNQAWKYATRVIDNALTDDPSQLVPRARLNTDLNRYQETSSTTVTPLGETDLTVDDANILKLWDMVTVDEASMLTMTDFLSTTAFYRRGGQLVIAGDHRQLPAIQQINWEKTINPSVHDTLPNLSPLEWVRIALTGDETLITDEIADITAVPKKIQSDALTINTLTQTYRCHDDVAQLLNKWVYSADNINYQSTHTETLTNKTEITAPDEIATVLSPETSTTLLTYSDPQYRQVNPLEAAITLSIIQTLPEQLSVGVITPHNAHKALLQQLIQKTDNTVSETDIDTVERFQGGERDIIIINATVSDPSYIAQEDEFLLDINRLTVALSRMKHKVIIIGGSSIFNHIPLSTDVYNDTLLWKGLMREAELDTNSKAQQTITASDLTETLPQIRSILPTDAEDTKIRIHTKINETNR